MGTTLWRVEVFMLAGDTVRLAVKMADADEGPFKPAKELVLRMLYEPSVELNDECEMVALGPIGSALDDGKVFSETYLPKHAHEFIASVEVSNIVNGDLTPKSVRAKVESALLAEGHTRGESEWDELVEERSRAFWADPRNTPTAVYTIRVTDEKWIAHLKVGQKWGSGAFA
jgi:hypothetical protein